MWIVCDLMDTLLVIRIINENKLPMRVQDVFFM